MQVLEQQKEEKKLKDEQEHELVIKKRINKAIKISVLALGIIVGLYLAFSIGTNDGIRKDQISDYENKVLEYFESIEYDSSSMYDKDLMTQQNKLMTNISLDNIDDKKLKTIVDKFILGCNIQLEVNDEDDLATNVQWNKGQALKSGALLNLSKFEYLYFSKNKLETQCLFYFVANNVVLNHNNYNIQIDENGSAYYNLRVENNTGYDFDGIRFVSIINEHEDSSYLYDFYSGDSEILTFKYNGQIDDGEATVNFYVDYMDVADD